MRSFGTVLAAFVLLTAAAVGAEDLSTFLKAATAATRPTAPLRGDGTLVTTSPDGTGRDQLAVVRRPNGDMYVELHDAGVRALVLADGKTALIVSKKGGSPEVFALDAPLGGSEFTREDLRPFNAELYRSPAIADIGSDDLTVSLTPDQSQYALQVITFDRAKKVPLVVKNYKDTASNLVKMRRNAGWVSVGGIWLPSDISMENFPMRVTSTATLRWQATEDTPALFDPAALGKPSTLVWPAQAAGG
jgi:hypothetical protein